MSAGEAERAVEAKEAAEKDGDDAESGFRLHQEILLLRKRVAQREEALTRLNARLRQLEQGVAPETTILRKELAELEAERGRLEDARHAADAQVRRLTDELDALRSTKTFRYTSGVRDMYRRARLRRSSR